jgi:hypothetical protein
MADGAAAVSALTSDAPSLAPAGAPPPPPPPPGKRRHRRRLAFDALNFLREMLDEGLMRRNPMCAVRAMEARVAAFAAAAERAGYELWAVVDADVGTLEARDKCVAALHCAAACCRRHHASHTARSHAAAAPPTPPTPPPTPPSQRRHPPPYCPANRAGGAPDARPSCATSSGTWSSAPTSSSVMRCASVACPSCAR